ncbi:MAG TPA: hypothetical protein VJ853_04790, partial [Thermoanaerobaculia bacterium]|nr:hypothetical protein [Thermoanaerobaculia bacterium]
NRGGGGIFVMGRTGEAVKRITTSGFEPSWSPDGSQIVYASERIEVNPQNSQGISTLWAVNANGGAPRKLNSGPDATQPKVSPHNKRIAYMARLVAGQVDVWTMSLDGKSRLAVTHDLPTDWSPFWSPDGKFLYFCSDRGGSMNLWRVPIDEESGRTLGALQPVTTPAAFVAHPSISADGSRIAYSSVVRSANIQMLPLDPVTGKVAGEPAWVTTGSRSWSSPDPSPDGQWVAFYSIIQPEGHLYVVRTNGTELRQLTSDSAIDRMPRWSPDGKWLAFFSNRSGPLEIWKMRPDGADLQRLTALGSTAYTTWPRDGSFVIASLTSGKIFRLDPNRTFDQQKPEMLDSRDPAHAMLPNSIASDNRRLAVQLGPVSFGIGVFDIAAKKLAVLTTFGEWPVWLPDDRHILFVARGKEFWTVDSVTKETRKIFSVTRDVLGPPRLTRDGRAAFYSRRITEADVWIATLSDTAGTSPAAR